MKIFKRISCPTVIRRAALACVAAGSVAACARDSQLVVNRMGVDNARYERDFAACKQQAGASLSLESPVATCMTGKGYQVLMGK